MNNKLSQCLALTAVAGSLAFAGCGGSDSDDGPSAEDAQRAYAAAEAKLTAFGTQLGEALTNAGSQTDAQLATQFSDLSDEVDEQIDDIQALEVPEDLTKSKDDLVDALKDGQDDIEAIASAAQANDAAAARTAATQLVADSKDVTEARKSLKEALDNAAK